MLQRRRKLLLAMQLCSTRKLTVLCYGRQAGMTARKRRDEASQRRKQSMAREQLRKDRLRDGRGCCMPPLAQSLEPGVALANACVPLEQRHRRQSNGRRSRTSTSPTLNPNWQVSAPSAHG